MAKILVVDDNDDIRRLTHSYLTSEGHRVQLASGGDVALESMRADPPDVVILDIMMPGMDGYGVLRQMSTEGLKSRIKVLVLTAKNSEADWIKGYRLGADDYLTKPFDLDELSACLERVLAASSEQLQKRRAEEIEKAQLLSRLESAFDDF